MSPKAGYKGEETKKIPEHWKLVRLSEVAKIVRGYSYSAQEINLTGNGYPFFTLNNISKGGGTKTDEVLHVNSSRIGDDQYLNNQMELLIAITDVSREGNVIGAPILIEPSKVGLEKAVFSMDLVKVSPEKDEVDKRFLFYHLLNSSSRRYMKAHSQGTNVLHLDVSGALQLPVTIPPYEEQQKIASILSTLDDIIQKTDLIISETRQLKRGLMQQLLTKGIGHTKFKRTELGEVPYEWQEVKLGNVCKLLPGYAFKSSEFIESGVRLLRGANIGIEEIQWDDVKYFPRKRLREFSRYVLHGGEIVIGMDRPFVKDGLKVAVLPRSDGPCLLVQRVGRFIPSEKIRPEFLYTYLRSNIFSDHLRLQQQGMDLPHVSQIDIESAPLLLPRVREQEAIGRMAETLDNKTGIETTKKAKLELVKMGLMHDLLSGRVRVKVD
jgi:type I restriction enzyme S subunit